MSITGYYSPVGVSRRMTTSLSSDAPWALPPKLLVIKPTVSTRYDQPFVYNTGAVGLVGHPGSTSGGVFDIAVLRRLKRSLSLHLRILRQKIRRAKSQFFNFATLAQP